MRQIEVRIMGQSYLLGCAEGAEQELLDAVQIVDREMCAIRDGGKLRARERIAVLAALNLAVMLAQQKKITPLAAAAVPSGVDSQTCQTLINRIDAVMGSDDQLL